MISIARLLLRQREIHVDLGVHCDRLIFQPVRKIAPFPHCLHGRWNQFLRTRYPAQALNCPLFADLGAQDDRALNPCLPCRLRIFGQDFFNQQARAHTLLVGDGAGTRVRFPGRCFCRLATRRTCWSGPCGFLLRRQTLRRRRGSRRGRIVRLRKQSNGRPQKHRHYQKRSHSAAVQQTSLLRPSSLERVGFRLHPPQTAPCGSYCVSQFRRVRD